jgi:hypothetical protein
LGFGRDQGYESVAVLIALVAGRGTLRRTVAEIADDREVCLSQRHVRRVMDELEQAGLIVRSLDQSPRKRRRGRTANVWLLAIDWEVVTEVVADQNARSEPVKNHAIAAAGEASDLRTSSGQTADIVAASSGHLADNNAAFENHSLSSPLPQESPVPRSPESSSKSAATCSNGERENQRFGFQGRVTKVTKEATTATAVRLFGGLEYRGNNASTLWLAAAAFDVGWISEHEMRDSVAAAFTGAPNVEDQRIAYFRTSLAEAVGLGESCDDVEAKKRADAKALTRLLSCIRFGGGGIPSGPPVMTSAAASVTVRIGTDAKEVKNRRKPVPQESQEVTA